MSIRDRFIQSLLATLNMDSLRVILDFKSCNCKETWSIDLGILEIIDFTEDVNFPYWSWRSNHPWLPTPHGGQISRRRTCFSRQTMTWQQTLAQMRSAFKIICSLFQWQSGHISSRIADGIWTHQAFSAQMGNRSFDHDGGFRQSDLVGRRALV